MCHVSVVEYKYTILHLIKQIYKKNKISIMIIKNYKTFLESIQDGHSEEFDKKWKDSEDKIEKILSISDEWVREELILMSNKELDDILSDLKSSENTTFKEYTTDKAYSFDSIFGITEEELNDYLSDMIDQFDYIDMSIISDDTKKFSIEIFSNDPSENLKSEFEWYKKEVSENFKTQLLNSYNLIVTSEKLDEKRNRIVLEVNMDSKK
jgi:hypothetical protein